MINRNLGQVIDSILEIAPDLQDHFTSLIRDIQYTAPEAMSMRWGDLSRIMNTYAINHPKKIELIAVVNRMSIEEVSKISKQT